jgi:DNA uptake protein ComE-like DNA-binding protein
VILKKVVGINKSREADLATSPHLSCAQMNKIIEYRECQDYTNYYSLLPVHIAVPKETRSLRFYYDVNSY